MLNRLHACVYPENVEGTIYPWRQVHPQPKFSTVKRIVSRLIFYRRGVILIIQGIYSRTSSRIVLLISIG